MKRYFIAILCCFTFIQCKKSEPTSFAGKALQQKVQTLDGSEKSLQEVFDSLKGKTVLVDIWASWCKDCRASFPKIHKLKEKYGNDVVFLYLSMDKDIESWKEAIEQFNLDGTHFYMGSEWKTDFNTSINLNWIPRFMIVGKDGSIKMFDAKTADDPHIVSGLDTDLH